jgi:tRNA A-37 threonylcarbamoyl transferase component Bud32
MPALLPGAVLADTYRVVRYIGRGGMGEVYEATHARLAGRYAIKALLHEFAELPEALERFRREAQITSSLRHPNIVQVVDFNQLPDGTPYLVIEFLGGHDLGATLQKSGPLPVADALSILEQVASALTAAHEQEIVHRDLKPQNIFLVPIAGQTRPLAKVVDFGISKIKAASQHLTRELTAMGTPQYMSPEQALGRLSEIDARTDQFALASIAHEMLMGTAAFNGDSLHAILYQVVNEPPPPLVLPDLPPEIVERIDRVLQVALTKDRNARFPTVAAFVAALAEAARGGTRLTAALPTTRPATLEARVRGVTPSPVTATVRRHWGPVAGVMVAVVVGALAMRFATSSRPAAPLVEAPSRPAPAAPVPPLEVKVAAPVVEKSVPKPRPSSKEHKPVRPRPAAEVAEPKPVELVTISVDNATLGVSVTIDGKPASLPIRLARDGRNHQLEFRSAKFRTERRSIRADADRAVHLDNIPNFEP